MRIGCTALDSFYLYLTQDWMEEDALLATLKGTSGTTYQMLIGTAFGRAIERPERYRKGALYVVPVKGDEWMEYAFSQHSVEDALMLFDRNGLFEVGVTQRYGEINVVAKADYLLGHELGENKTSLKPFTFDKYCGSFQWRFMLDMWEIPMITYNVFHLGEDRKTGELFVKETNSFNLFAYSDMHSDCAALVREFETYVRAKPGLVDILNEREQNALKYVKEF